MTDAQLQILKALHRRIRSGRAPSTQELAVDVGLSPQRVYQHLEKLRLKGLVDWRPRTARSWRITDAGKAALRGG